MYVKVHIIVKRTIQVWSPKAIVTGFWHILDFWIYSVMTIFYVYCSSILNFSTTFLNIYMGVETIGYLIIWHLNGNPSPSEKLLSSDLVIREACNRHLQGTILRVRRCQGRLTFVQSEWVLKHTRHLAISNRIIYTANNCIFFPTKYVAYRLQEGTMLLKGAIPRRAFPPRFQSQLCDDSVHKFSRECYN